MTHPQSREIASQTELEKTFGIVAIVNDAFRHSDPPLTGPSCSTDPSAPPNDVAQT